MRCAAPGPSISTCIFVVICTAAAITARVASGPRELDPTIIIESETGRFNFGLQLAASGPWLAVEDLVRVGDDTVFNIRIGRVRDGTWREEIRFPVGGWLHGMAVSRDAFAWRAGTDGVVHLARFVNGRWVIAETVDVDDERCRYVPELGENIFLEDDVLVVNGANNVCVFERLARVWRLAKVFARSARRELVVFASGRVISAVVDAQLVVVHTRTLRGWERSEIALPFRTGWSDIAASQRWLVLRDAQKNDLYVFDLNRGGALAAHVAPTDRSPAFGGDFVIDDKRLLVDDYYSRAYLFVFSHGRWRLDAHLNATDNARVALGDQAWVTLFRLSSEQPGRIAGFALE